MTITDGRWQKMSEMKDYSENRGMNEDSTPPMARALEELHKAAGILREDLGLLYDRLSPVQVPDRPTDPSAKSLDGGIPENSEVVRSIREVAEQLDSMTARLRYEKGRLEV